MFDTHDYRKEHRRWGHDYTFDPVEGTAGRSATMCGWGRGLKKGDYILMSHSEGGESRYQIDEVNYFSNPPDMWSAKVSFAPRQEQVEVP